MIEAPDPLRRHRDCIFVPGAAVRPDGTPSGTLRRRLEAAVAAARSLHDPVFLVSGGAGPGGRVEADVMAEVLIGLGVERDRILAERQAVDTLTSVWNVSRLLRLRTDLGRLYLCTSDYHRTRCQALLLLLGIATGCLAVPSERSALGRAKYLYYWMRELVALPRDLVRLAYRVLRGALGRKGT